MAQEEKILMLERKKLKEVITKLDEEEKNIEETLSKNSSSYGKSDFVKAHLEYLGHRNPSMEYSLQVNVI